MYGSVMTSGSSGGAGSDAAALLDALTFVHSGLSGGTLPVAVGLAGPRPGSLTVITGRAAPTELTALGGWERTTVVRVGTGLPALPAGLATIDVTSLADLAAAWAHA
jgi:hypothetical protein